MHQRSKVDALMLHAVRQGVAELTEQSSENRHAQDDEHERPTARGMQEAALDDDQNERERRGDPLKEERLHEARVDLRDFGSPREVGRYRWRSVDRRRAGRRVEAMKGWTGGFAQEVITPSR